MAETAVVYIHPGTVHASFAYCLLRLMVYEIGRTGIGPVVIAQRCASGQLTEARNDATAYFLSTPCDWMFVVDSDMGFDAPTLQALLATANCPDKPIVAALCFGLKKSGDDDALQAVKFHQFPTLYRWYESDTEVGFQVMVDYPRDQLVGVSASGAACFVVHRSVLEAMRDRFGDHWFSKMTHPTGPTTFSEDLSFFMRAAAVGTAAAVDTGVHTSHDKGGVFLTEETWDAQQALIFGQDNGSDELDRYRQDLLA